MRNFNLVELDIVYKNFSYFLEDFDSDIQKLTDIEEIHDLMGIQISRVVKYGVNIDIENLDFYKLECLISHAEELNDSEESKDIIEILNHLKLGLLYRTNIDSLSELKNTSEVFLKDIGELSKENKLLKRDFNSFDALFS